jgi:hypothetical protein
MPSSLHAAILSLASHFAASVVDAIRNSSLEEVLGDAGVSRRSPGRPRGSTASPSRASSRSRLQRRSPEAIAEALAHVVALVKKNKAGLRAEQIRKELGMEAKEMPRILKEGLAKKVLRSKGQKRATTYFS